MDRSLGEKLQTAPWKISDGWYNTVKGKIGRARYKKEEVRTEEVAVIREAPLPMRKDEGVASSIQAHLFGGGCATDTTY